jgi:hypothetical protein
MSIGGPRDFENGSFSQNIAKKIHGQFQQFFPKRGCIPLGVSSEFSCIWPSKL